ncbi:hypothetical protein EOJ36_03860 [Sandaracinomonas limnophila]|uniref:Lipoprotein n=1 Tax=Sandaracinomonas limnophila TaxID=1862386 RepID=A0A437PTI3_9BACT|nr:hypothetical protein [Sandaracinomonas limnophila]RVU25562.1 hypothetical protein EOJ36_03860 [Sandaracinomonas limnophila]
MKKSISKFLIFFFGIVSLFFLASCSKKSLNDEEKKVVEKFLIQKWGDIQFTVFSNETIPHELYLTFHIVDSKLKYKREENYFASFGNKSFLNEGDVNLFYDTKENRIQIELLGENGDVFQTCHIDVEKENLISKLNEQIALRTVLNTDLNKRLNDNYSYDEWSLKGIFNSKISQMRQSEDLTTLHYFHVDVDHQKKITPLTIDGLTSKSGKELIFWHLTEVYSGPKRAPKIEDSSVVSADTVAADTSGSEINNQPENLEEEDTEEDK